VAPRNSTRSWRGEPGQFFASPIASVPARSRREPRFHPGLERLSSGRFIFQSENSGLELLVFGVEMQPGLEVLLSPASQDSGRE
jgi:hypothetical protein